MLPDLPKRPRTANMDGRSFAIDEMRFLGSQSTLVGLSLKDCPIGDEHVRELCGLPRLINLCVDGTEVTVTAEAYYVADTSTGALRLVEYADYLAGQVRSRWYPDDDIVRQRTPWPSSARSGD